jgi:fatty-acyl-CoA synthase
MREPDFIRKTLAGVLEEMAARFPERDALVHPKYGVRLTYRQLNDHADKIARGFLAQGVQKGDHVAVWSANTPEWVYTLLACAKIGAVLVTVNTNYKVFELEYLLRQSDSRVLVVSDGIKGSDYIEILDDLAAAGQADEKEQRAPLLDIVLYTGKRDIRRKWLTHWDEMEYSSRRVRQEELRELTDSLDVHDIVNMQYTSGTTGFPKGVMLTNFNIVNNGYFIGECMKFTERDRLCIPVPFFHCFGLVLAMMAALTHGTAMVPVEVYSPAEVMQTVQDEKCTAVHGVPTMFIFMLDHPDFSKYDFSTLRTGIMAGSSCPMEVMRRVMDNMNMRDIVITYGQTECSPGMTMSRTDDPVELRVSTVGRLLPHTEGKVVDPETGAELPPNTPGEICTRGYHLMRGYYNMPEATAAAIDADGWLHTGDIGTVDENGYWAITGRLKDMIIRGGENIYPREIEELLYTNPAVQDVQVVGVPSQKFGEEVCAFVIPAKGYSPTEEEVKEFVRQRMSRHKIPAMVRFVDKFPMTASGKIQKYKLREMAQEA